jgi:nucleoside-diphosphate-sugar epimerase
MDGKKDESTVVEPHSTYGVAKVAADGLVQVRWKEAGTPAIAMRQFNCYGPRETHPYVIPEIIKRLSQSPNLKLGNNSSRDFQYATDAVRMAVELLEVGELGEVYNMGSEDTIQIYDLAHRIGQLMGIENINIETDQALVRPWEIWHLQSDNQKLYDKITTRPQTSFDDGLLKTIEYFRNNGGWDY